MVCAFAFSPSDSTGCLIERRNVCQCCTNPRKRHVSRYPFPLLFCGAFKRSFCFVPFPVWPYQRPHSRFRRRWVLFPVRVYSIACNRAAFDAIHIVHVRTMGAYFAVSETLPRFCLPFRQPVGVSFLICFHYANPFFVATPNPTLERDWPISVLSTACGY